MSRDRCPTGPHACEDPSWHAEEYWTQRSPNLMTPERLEFHTLANGWLVEISQGESFRRDERGIPVPIWGVSIATAQGEHLTSPISRLLHSLEAAQAYVMEVDRDPGRAEIEEEE